jgi:hypothetical protein
MKICNEKRSGKKGLWCSNDAQIALSYGKILICVHIPEGNWDVEVYPLSTGKLTNTIDWRSEPMEFFIRENVKVDCTLAEL